METLRYDGTAASTGGRAEPPALLADALRVTSAGRATTVLRVAGEPGGFIYLVDGQVTAIDTPGAPGPEVILLRSGRVTEADWTAVFAAAAAVGQLGAELSRRGAIGAGHLEAVLRLALADAMFVLASGQVTECRTEPPGAGHLLPLLPGMEPSWLLAEAERRMRALAALPDRLDHDRDRPAAVPGARPPAGPPGSVPEDLVNLANGRRTARDMAFVLGRGVYATTVQLSALHRDGLLTAGSRRRPASGGRAAGGGRAAAGGSPGGRAAGAPPADEAAPLPKRRRGMAALPWRSQAADGPPEAPPPDRALFRVLRLGPGPAQDHQD